MASTYSTNLKIELIGTGEQAGTWGTTTNSNLGTALEQAIVGKADVTMSSTTITLTLTNSNAAQDARAIYLNLTGSPGGAAVLEVPAIQKPYIVKNGTTGGFAVTVKVTGQTGVVIPAGSIVLVYNDGTDVGAAVNYIPSLTVDGTDAVGFRNTPVNSQDEAYETVLADSGKTILHPVADDNARTFTIPANSSVAYPVGTVISFVNLQNTVTIAITTDTMYLANDGDTGDRTLAEYGTASAMKVASTTWIISGNGLT
jgi:hypothetical protein